MIAPIDIGYNTECFITGVKIIEILNHFLSIILSFEIIINCFTAIPDEKNNYNYKLDFILVNYIKGDLFIDLLIAFPWHVVVAFNTKPAGSVIVALAVAVQLLPSVTVTV